MDDLVDRRKKAIGEQIEEKMKELEEIDCLLGILEQSEGPKGREIKHDLNSVLSEEHDDVEEITELLRDIDRLKAKRNRYIAEADQKAFSQDSHDRKRRQRR